jgi:two-component system, OmpR family, alkaline phosphatase synthesis response regulator PhoP
VIRALLVDDETPSVRALRRLLEKRGAPRVRLDDCRTARAALSRLRSRRYDAVLVDWVLGDACDGLELGRRIRELPNGPELPLIMLTGHRKTSQDELAALRAGFDDFLCKPLDVEILRLRLAAAVKRATHIARSPPSPTSHSKNNTWAALADEALAVLPDEPVALVRSRRVDLSYFEWRLLCALYKRRGDVVGRAALVGEVWGAEAPADPGDSLDQLLRSLRRKIDPLRELVETVYGQGLRLRSSIKGSPQS